MLLFRLRRAVIPSSYGRILRSGRSGAKKCEKCEKTISMNFTISAHEIPTFVGTGVAFENLFLERF